MKEILEGLLRLAESLELDGATDITLYKSTRGYASVTILKDGVFYRGVRPSEGQEAEFIKNENKAEKL